MTRASDLQLLEWEKDIGEPACGSQTCSCSRCRRPLAESEWEQKPVCNPPVQPSLAGRLLAGLKLVQHLQIGRTCLQDNACSWKSDACPTIMSPAGMNPGFITSSDTILIDTRLNVELANLLLNDPHYRTFLHQNGATKKPHSNDKIRVALVDLGAVTTCQSAGIPIITSKKICTPGYAEWGSLEPMFAASTGKIGIVYAAYQMLSDLRETAVIYANTIRTKANLFDKMNRDAWKSLVCKPDLSWLFTFDDTVNPVKVEMSASLDDYLKRMVGGPARFSTQLAFELILRIGFEYLASVLWQSGLRHPRRRGLWFHNSYEADTIDNRLINTACHKKASYFESGRQINYVVWTKDPMGGVGIDLNALSAATFFTLMAQRRLVNPQLSQQMEALLRTGCWLSGSTVPAGARRLAVKCGAASNNSHDAALIINGGHCYVLVLLINNATGLDRGRLVNDLDRLVRNNP